MILNISDLPPAGVRFGQDVEIPPFSWEGGDVVSCRPVRTEGSLRRTRRGIELKARFSTTAHLHCARCLTAFDRNVEGDFRLLLVPPPAEGDEVLEPVPEGDPDEADLYPLEFDQVDMAAVLREQVDLALPYRVLCRDECRGLCPRCGTDLNFSECRCEPEPDARWESLRGIRDILQKRTGPGPDGKG